MYYNILYLILLCNLYWLNINAETQTTEDPDNIIKRDVEVMIIPKDHILNGKEVTTHKYPFMVSLQKRFPNGRKVKFCGGVILSHFWILTAAHCFDSEKNNPVKSDFRVNAGILNAFNYDSPPSQYIQIERIETHPLYSRRTFINDIAMLKLVKPFVYTDYLKPIQLPPRDYQAKGVGNILGWGAIDHEEKNFPRHLRVASIDVSRIRDCGAFFNFLSEKRHICLGFGGKTNACLGDSGGPFLKIYKGEITVVGITSFGKEGCHEGIPIIYTNVAFYVDWIEMTMGKKQNGFIGRN